MNDQNFITISTICFALLHEADSQGYIFDFVVTGEVIKAWKIAFSGCCLKTFMKQTFSVK